MVRFPLVGLEGVEPFACSKVAAIVAACRVAAAAIPALPIRNRRRDGEGGAGGAMAGLSGVAGLVVDLIDSSLEAKRSRSGNDAHCFAFSELRSPKRRSTSRGSR